VLEISPTFGELFSVSTGFGTEELGFPEDKDNRLLVVRKGRESKNRG
jgi:hypothetical protein